MKLSKICLTQSNMSGYEQKYIQEVFNSDGVVYKNHNLDSFEESLENYLGNHSCVRVLNSGTAVIPQFDLIRSQSW